MLDMRRAFQAIFLVMEARADAPLILHVVYSTNHVIE